MELFWLLEEHGVQDLLILWFIALVLSGLGPGESLLKVPHRAQWQMTQLWEAEWESDRITAPVKTPSLSVLGKSWNKDEVAPRWDLRGIPHSPVFKLSSSPRECLSLETLQVQLSLSLGGEHFSPHAGPSQASAHLASPGLCCTYKACASNSGKHNLGKYQGIVDPPYLVAIFIKLALWALVSQL